MKRFTHVFVLIVGMLWLWHSGPGFAAEPRIALVIGNSRYAESPLANPVNDALLIAETLRGLGFEVIERTDVDQKAIQLASFELQDRLIAAGKDAVGLFYYAGHGVQIGGENYLIPLGSNIKQEREVAINAVSASFVLQQMEFAGNRMNFVILDACRNNPLTRRFRSATRGLARMDAPTGSLIAYSTGPGEVAADGTGANSPYSLALAEALVTPGIAAEKMFKLVRDSVMSATNGEQIPWEESSLTGADFYFRVDVSTLEASATSDIPASSGSGFDERQLELSFWQSIKDSRNAGDFEAYLQQFPDGVFAQLARIRIAAIALPESLEPIETKNIIAALPQELEPRLEPAASDAGMLDRNAFRRLREGTRVDYDNWSYRVDRVSDFETHNDAGVYGHFTDYAVFLRLPTCGYDGIDDDAKRSIETIWPLAPGKQVRLTLPGGQWANLLVSFEVVRTETLRLQGREYFTYVVENQATSLWCKMERTLWYAPELGVIVKEQTYISGDESEHPSPYTYELSNFDQPKGSAGSQ